MADDWDPFADPADTDPKPHAVAPKKDQMKKAIDIFAALSAPAREPQSVSSDDFEMLLDAFFAAEGADSDILDDIFRPVAEAIEDNAALRILLWKRGVSFIHDCVDESSTAKLNVLGLMLDEYFGFCADLSNNWPNGVSFEPPSGTPCGVVIFLFGWGGAQCSDMDDVAEVYRELFPGAGIARLEVNRFDSWGLRLEVAQAIRAATWTWSRMGSDGTPRLLVHLFSNGGYFTWEEMLMSWQQVSQKGEQVPELDMPLPPMCAVLRGIVLDSSPDSTPELGSQIQSLAQSVAPMVRGTVEADHDGSETGRKDAEMRGKRAVLEVIGPSSPVKRYLAQKHGGDRLILHMCSARVQKVHELEPPVPMQFIYSVADAIIRYQGIENYVQEVKDRPHRRGLQPPRQLRFEKSKHCLHKLEKRDEYFSCVRSFAAEVLSSDCQTSPG